MCALFLLMIIDKKFKGSLVFNFSLKFMQDDLGAIPGLKR